jgi:phosphate transport system substrate-binding protein
LPLEVPANPRSPRQATERITQPDPARRDTPNDGGLPRTAPSADAGPGTLHNGAPSGGKSRSKLLLAGIVAFLALAAVAAWFALSGGSMRAPETAQPAPAPPAPPAKAEAPPPPPAAAERILALHGSNTIGAALAPSLVEGFLRQEGYSDIKRVAGRNAGELTLEARSPQGAQQAVEIQAHGSGTAFKALQEGRADIGMSSRRIKPEEVSTLASLGDMTGPANEHVIALDGIAIVVHPNKLVAMLTRKQVADIFAGRITDWSQVKGTAGPIHLYARDDKSGTFDTFQNLVLGSEKLSPGAKRFEDSAELSDAVANDPSGIGFIGLPYIRNARALAISDPGATPLIPGRFTVATEDYVLSRRLYLYTSENPRNPLLRRFIAFAQSKAGQEVVGNGGFVPQTVRPEALTADAGAPAEYRKLTQGAQRLSLNFRFRTGSADLDNKARLDLDRVVEFLSDMKVHGQSIMLFGFADNQGGRDLNLKLSRERAQAVAAQFQQRGIKPGLFPGFGHDLPVASNDTEEGRAKNRRVEIWVKQ